MPDGTDSGHSAFISYASPDSEKADEICASLEERGLRCWIAPRDVRAGREYGEEIIRGIERSRCLVLVLSEAANESTFVRREVERAVSKKKPVFPIRVEEVVPSPALEFFVASTHWIDAWTGDIVTHIDRLARDLKDDSKIESAAAASRKIVRRRQMPKWIAAGLAFVGIVGAIVIGNALSGRGGGAREADQSTQPNALDHSFSTDPNAWIDTQLQTYGVDPAGVSKGDIRVALTKPSRLDDIYHVTLGTNEGLKRALDMCTLHIAFNDGEFIRQGLSKGEGFRLAESEVGDLSGVTSLTLRFDLPLPDKRAIGPFTYELSVQNAMLEHYKQAAINDSRSLPGNSGLLWFEGLPRFFPAVRRIHVGESEDLLDVTIEVPPTDGIEPGSDKAERYRFVYPYPPGVTSYCVQYEFLDGTRSPVQQVDLGLQFPEPRSVRISPADAQSGAPDIYFAPHPGESWILPLVPPNTRAVRYATSPGPCVGESHTGLRDREGVYRGFSITTDVANGFIQLEYELADGTIIGPVRYELGDAVEHQVYKAELKQHVRSAAIAFRIDPADTYQAMNARGDVIREYGVNIDHESFETQHVLLVPAAKTLGREVRILPTWWAAVKEVQYGTQPGALNSAAEVNGELGIQARYDSDIWSATLPFDTEQIFLRYVFTDGEVSEELQVPIIDLGSGN